MKCPKCQFENLNGMNFCGKCGAKLEQICPRCNFSNPAEYEFCGKCGHNLTMPSEPVVNKLSFDEKLDKIQRYLPKGLTEKILSQRDRIEGERKQVTVMFCDMEGYSQLSERLGPEEAYDIMDQVCELLIHKVHDYEGTVNEMTGDGIIALFGAPIALEDAPQSAIRSALAIHREMTKFNDALKREKQGALPLKMRIGIHTGPVVVCMDMSPAYISSVTENLTQAQIVFDHFHVIKMFNDKLDELRRKLYRDADTALQKRVLKGTRWLILKSPKKLDETLDGHERLNGALELNQPLAIAYYLKEDLRQLWSQDGKSDAESFLDHWISLAEAFKVPLREPITK